MVVKTSHRNHRLLTARMQQVVKGRISASSFSLHETTPEGKSETITLALQDDDDELQGQSACWGEMKLEANPTLWYPTLYY
jgi:hypothetical protein